MGVLYLCSMFALFTSAGCLREGVKSTEEFGCDIWELTTCGNNKGLYSWEFCRPQTQHTKKILSVHLDVRYQNRYCRTYGTPKNFGLTEPGDSMWVINSCYGTFLLCLELEFRPTTTPTTSVRVSTVTESTTQDGVPHAPNKHYSVPVTENTKSNKNVTQKEQQRLFHDNSTKHEVVENIEIVNVNEKETLDFTTKVIIIAAIATAGLCIMCLVATIGCFMMRRRDGFGIEAKRQIEIEAESTTATSLPVSEYQEQEGIYNVIPFDEDGSIFEKDNSNYNKVNLPVERTDNSLKEPDPHIYATFARIDNRSSTLGYEHEYDRLRSKPKVSVSDSSTYNRLGDVCRDEEQNIIYDVCKNP